MIRGIRRTTALLCLVLAVLSSLPQPSLADEGAVFAPRGDVSGTTPSPHRLDLERYLLAPVPGVIGAPRHSFADTTPAAQSSQGWSSYSTAKKTWIVVGIVVGAAAIAVAVSNNGDDDGDGGGGY